MGHGTPDWWGSEPGETTFMVQDVGELAARLGSIDVFDRRGNVVWLSGFENGLGEFYSVTSGAGASVLLSTATAHRGAYSCKLTTGSDIEKMASIMKVIAYPALSKFAGEGAFTWNTGIADLQFLLILYDGTNSYTFAVRFSQALGQIHYLNSAGGWTLIDTLPPWATATYLFQVAKLTVDLETGKYRNLILGDTGYDLSGISGYTVASATQPYLVFSIQLTGPGATNPSIYVDDVIITQNEP